MREETPYIDFQDTFWSLQQADRDPYCVFKAPNARSVSVAILVSRATGCPFAAKSGGHAAFEDASNIQDGITISLENLNDISLSNDRSTVTIGPGNNWHRVYSHLAEYGLATIGGRVASIGVGGLTTGGGISFFSNKYGWACDNVASYDVAIASGAQVIASPDSNMELYWALRGGGNNFGIVLSFTMYTIPMPGNKMWTSARNYDWSSFPLVARAFYNSVVESPSDPDAGLWVAWSQSNQTPIASANLWDTRPKSNISILFDHFTAISTMSEVTRNVTLVEYTAEMDDFNPTGFRETYYGLTVKADPELADVARQIFYEELPMTESVQGAFPVMVYQGITAGQMSSMAKRGGNPLGLNDLDGPLFLFHIACWWELQSDDDVIYTFASKVLQRIKGEAERRGKASRFLYMNYSSKFEDVIASYGEENKKRLKDVATKYDPRRIFQELQPGYFKLDRSPQRDHGYFSG